MAPPVDAIVIGGGIAGLAAALGLVNPDELPAKRRARVTLLSKTAFAAGGSSVWAQGGVAAALAPGDSPALHAADTLAVAGGLGERDAVTILTTEGPLQVKKLIELGARFDSDAAGQLSFGREAAHSQPRILHADGDATGAEMVRVLAAALARTGAIEIVEMAFAYDLVLDQSGAVAGVLARHADGRIVLHQTGAVIVATGGIGQLYRYTTNPRESTGDGLAMAARAGARLMDLEFVQFHPTAMVAGADPMPLVSEAVRGEGAFLVNDLGERFMTAVHPLADLAPRDIVARAIWREQMNGRRVFLDARASPGERFPQRFPNVFRRSLQYGVDPRHDLIPVSPAAHYHMGGIAVDEWGRSTVAGLWACGEVTTTGVHGANRLASNSLLEALVYGARVAVDVGRTMVAGAPDGDPNDRNDEWRKWSNGRDEERQTTDDMTLTALASIGSNGPLASAPDSLNPHLSLTLPSGSHRDSSEASLAALRQEIRTAMWEGVGLVRNGEGLESALGRLETVAGELPDGPSEVANMALVARLITSAALARRESRGAHFRTDYPQVDDAWSEHLAVRLEREPNDGGPSSLWVRGPLRLDITPIAVERRAHGWGEEVDRRVTNEALTVSGATGG